MTKEELTALRRERGKQELNIGDRVKVYDQTGNILFGGKTAIIIEKALLDPTEFYYGLYVEGETADKFRGKGLLYLKNTATKISKTALLAPFFAEDLELVRKPKHFVGEQPLTVERARKEMEGIASEIANNPEKAEQIQKEWEEAVSAKEQPTDEIKVGDRVKFKSEEEIKKMLEPSFWWGISIFADKEATIIGIDEPYGYRIDIDPSLGGIRREFFDKIPKKQPSNTITIPVKVDLDDTYWDAYHAELVKELAVKVANNNTINDSMIAYHIIGFATQIVNNLKKQSE